MDTATIAAAHNTGLSILCSLSIYSVLMPRYHCGLRMSPRKTLSTLGRIFHLCPVFDRILPGFIVLESHAWVTIKRMRRNKDELVPSKRQNYPWIFLKSHGDFGPTYLCRRIPLATFISYQMAHQVTAIGRSASEGFAPRISGIFIKLDLTPVRQTARFLSWHISTTA